MQSVNISPNYQLLTAQVVELYMHAIKNYKNFLKILIITLKKAIAKTLLSLCLVMLIKGTIKQVPVSLFLSSFPPLCCIIISYNANHKNLALEDPHWSSLSTSDNKKIIYRKHSYKIRMLLH